MNRHGLSLIELVVAISLFGVLLLGAAGAAADALRRTRTEARRGHALSAALSVADSLAALTAPASGEREVGDSSVRWTAARSAGLLHLRLHAHPRGDTITSVELELVLAGAP